MDLHEPKPQLFEIHVAIARRVKNIKLRVKSYQRSKIVD